MIDFGNKLKDVTSNKNQFNELSKKVKAISTKGSTKDLISTEQNISLGIFQIYLVFIPGKNYIAYFLATTRIH